MLKAILTALLKFISILPLAVVQGLGRFIGFVFGRIVRHHRKDAFEALERSMPELTPGECKRIINTMYRMQGINAVEMIWYSMRGLESVSEAVEIIGIEHAEEALLRGKGLIALTAHIGNYELIPMVTASMGYKSSVIVKRIKNKPINELVEMLRSHEGLTFLSTKNAYRDCLKALRRNEVVGMIIDQNMTSDEGIFADFFGKLACTSPGLAYMSAQSKAPVLPVFISRKSSGGFSMRIYPLLEPPEDRSVEATHAATTIYNKVIEDEIRRVPEQWIWMHRRWRTQPRAGSSVKERYKG